MLVRVTQEHINQGVRCDSYACPVALAVKQYFPKHKSVVVTPTYIRIIEPDDQHRDEDPIDGPLMEESRVWLHADTPHEVAEFIGQFDGNGEWLKKLIEANAKGEPKPLKENVKPFQFEIEFHKMLVHPPSSDSDKNSA